MINVRLAKVLNIIRELEDMCEIMVEVEQRQEKAINYNHLSGPVKVDDMVYLNITAIKLGLGTGGYHFVISNLSHNRLDDDKPGHLMKLRYTPFQVKVLSVEEEASPYRQKMQECQSLSGTPVVVASLHSMLAPTAVAVKKFSNWGLKVVYVMTDGAALPISFSNLVRELKGKGFIDGTVTVGHAFGGDLEAVNIYTGLIAAKQCLEADVIIVAMGPGIVGTGTELGFTGVEQGEIINAVNILGGKPIAVPRISFADKRSRHQGISHHTLTVLDKISLTPAIIPIPQMEQEKTRHILIQLRERALVPRHRVLLEDGQPALSGMDEYGLRVTTMGRGPEEDPEFFLAAGAAGVTAAKTILTPTALPVYF